MVSNCPKGEQTGRNKVSLIIIIKNIWFSGYKITYFYTLEFHYWAKMLTKIYLRMEFYKDLK